MDDVRLFANVQAEVGTIGKPFYVALFMVGAAVAGERTAAGEDIN